MAALCCNFALRHAKISPDHKCHLHFFFILPEFLRFLFHSLPLKTSFNSCWLLILFGAVVEKKSENYATKEIDDKLRCHFRFQSYKENTHIVRLWIEIARLSFASKIKALLQQLQYSMTRDSPVFSDFDSLPNSSIRWEMFIILFIIFVLSYS